MRNATKSSISERLVKALAKIDRPGTFCTSGSAAAVMPGLEVGGIGAIGLPPAAGQIEELKQRCEQAPYGKGQDTLVDTAVRRVWRLTPDRFALTNPAWKTFIDEAVDKVRAELGLEGQKLEAHLYDLLLYEAGSFFLPHRDGEKLDRMVATLVVVLPSNYKGGELVVRHEGQEQVVDFGGADSQFKIQFAAFYADCEHEVKPLRSGHRLCLIYNLTLAKSKKALGAPRNSEHIPKVAEILRDWKDAADAPPKLAVTLAHQYTQEGLSWDALKGVDRARASVLAEAAAQAGCQAFLALLTFWESGSAEGDDGYGYGYGRRSRYDEYEDDEDNEGDEHHVEGNYTMSEVFDTSLTAEHWLCPDGDRPPLGKIPVEPEEVAPPESLTSVEPEEDFEGYTGNAGMTLDRWYRHGVICLWPNERELDVLCQVGSREALPALTRMVSSWRGAQGAEAEALRARCIDFASRILAKWPENPHRDWREWKEDDAAPDPMASLNRLDDPQPIRDYLGDVLVKDAALEPGKATVKAIVRHGWAKFRPQLLTLFKATNAQVIDRNVRLLEQICLAGARGDARKGESPDTRGTCRPLAEITVAALHDIDAKKEPDDWRLTKTDRSPMLTGLTRALLAAELDDLLGKLVAHIQHSPALYALRPVQLPVFAALGPWLLENLKQCPSALSHWIATCRQQLESLTAAVPQPPGDFRRDADIKCGCRDCAELKRFLLDSEHGEGRFQMAQARRRHLESLINRAGCDLNCKTDTRRNPQILVCTKNTASYERRLKQYREDLKSLAHIRVLEERLSR